MPQLNPEFFVSQLFWLAVTFVFLFIFLWKISLPRIASVLEKRQNKINDDLTSAKELQEQAQEIENKINSQLAKAREDTDQRIKDSLLNLNDDISNQLSSLDSDLNEKIIKADKEINKNKNDQMKNIKEEIIAITKSSVVKIANLNISNEDISNAIKVTEKKTN